ncbi:MAG: rod shape-determining protein, partial [Dehalococcoidia bacterium]
RDAAEQAGARKPAHLVPEPLAAAIGSQIPVNTPRGNMIVNIGGGRTEAAVISLWGIVVWESVRMAGDRIDEAIVAYVRRRHNLIIGEKTAEEVKIAIGSALPFDEGLTTQVRGRDQLSGLPKTIVLNSVEVAQAIQDCLGTIVQTVRAVLEKTPPELASDVIDRGISLTGGGALLRHIDELLTQETGVPCYVADSPLECVAIGAGIAMDYLDVIKRSLPTEEENLVGLFPSPER